MGAISVKHVVLSLALILPTTSNSSNVLIEPGSSLNGGVVTFYISCSDMPQNTTIDIDNCLRIQLTQIEWVRNKYSTAALNRLKEDHKNEPQCLRDLTEAFDAESEAWSELVEKASTSVESDASGGVTTNSAIASRQISLQKLRTHDIWEHWLRFEDSTPPVLPEPQFKSDR
ncbi:hypothetical protein [Escherichia albertii]|uniref:hypothetical protein n=1 Tax=Escherichia albertii TaxID=208962 RepID=UPI0011EE0CF2|nr:hypothetical protein [Escherichia albertii]